MGLNPDVTSKIVNVKLTWNSNHFREQTKNRKYEKVLWIQEMLSGKVINQDEVDEVF